MYLFLERFQLSLRTRTKQAKQIQRATDDPTKTYSSKTMERLSGGALTLTAYYERNLFRSYDFFTEFSILPAFGTKQFPFVIRLGSWVLLMNHWFDSFLVGLFVSFSTKHLNRVLFNTPTSRLWLEYSFVTRWMIAVKSALVFRFRVFILLFSFLLFCWWSITSDKSLYSFVSVLASLNMFKAVCTKHGSKSNIERMIDSILKRSNLFIWGLSHFTDRNIHWRSLIEALFWSSVSVWYYFSDEIPTWIGLCVCVRVWFFFVICFLSLSSSRPGSQRSIALISGGSEQQTATTRTPKQNKTKQNEPRFQTKQSRCERMQVGNGRRIRLWQHSSTGTAAPVRRASSRRAFQ